MMQKDKWIEVIKNFHESPFPAMIERETKIPPEVPISRAVSITGPRRVGKTYEMLRLAKTAMETHGKESALYVNLERADLAGVSVADLMNMLEAFRETYPSAPKPLHLFLDEVQNVDGWERFARTALDEGIKVYLSGSSSKLLSREIATSMRGRSLTYTLLPFSFREFLAAKGIKPSLSLSSGEKAKIRNTLAEYMEYGGYPEAVVYPAERERILSEIMETAIYRDVIERAKIRNVNAMRLLIRALIGSKEFSVNRFYNFLRSSGVRAGKNALHAYLRYLNEAFFVFLVRNSYRSYKKVEQSIPKVYFADNGLLKVNGIDDKGRLMENLVFVELLRRGRDVSYYKSYQLGEEVDFVIKEGKRVARLIQVSYDMSEPRTRERELKALLKASVELGCRDMLVITPEHEGEERVAIRGMKANVRFAPLWKWLLRPE